MLECADVLPEPSAFFFRQCPEDEPFKDIFLSLPGRMAHVFSIKTIVPQFIHHYLIAWKIIPSITKNILDSQQKGRLAELVAVSAVSKMSDRADSEDELLPGNSLSYHSDNQLFDPRKVSLLRTLLRDA